MRARLLATYLLLCAAGCTSPSRHPYAVPADAARDTARAQELTQRAARIQGEHPDEAERLLRDAVVADLYHGPAHNNLGVIFLERGQLYEAAHEFEWARKLMPGHPDPRLNLALTLERAGRVDDALETYGAALEVYPNHVPTMQALCRLQLRSDQVDVHTRKYLADLCLQGETERWRVWAREQLLRLDR